MPQLLGLIFDLDGTLVDSAGDLRQALNSLLLQYDRRPLTLAEVKGMIGDGLQNLLQRAFAATGARLPDTIAKTAFQDFLFFYQSQTASRDMLYPLATETLDLFRARGVKIGLCTNKLYEPTLKLLIDLGISNSFDFIAGSDSFPVYKPHPGHVSGVVKALGIPVENCAMIGDSANDIRAAQGAGVQAIAIGHGYGSDVGALGADAVIDSFAALPQALRRLGLDFVA